MKYLETFLNDKVSTADHDSLATRVLQLEHEAEIAKSNEAVKDAYNKGSTY